MFNHFAVRLAGVILPLVILGVVGTLFLTGGNSRVDAAVDHAATRPAAPATRPADDDYPVDVCPVTGEKLGSMGEPPSKVIDGRTVKVCCAGCFKTFEADPETYHVKLDDLILDATEDDYPLETCLVMPEDDVDGDSAMTTVYRPTNQVVKFCCGTCEVAFLKEPEKYLARLNEAE